ncbi:zinc finger protein 585A-like [Toxorhynchites rutilus septentrionalis]|uniref:zinc finger protein 585A-like n=1 Tax=Toxorhynchites rutilus septentrionalis TaxID=329112 RepID=UPI0024798862|nr:zinc finger protein 585A-like [Toxorhynchites rutilus septentrionalis]
MDICRTCLQNSTGDLVPIFAKLEDEFIANVIVNCCSVTILEDDGLPACICKNCLASVSLIVSFSKKVLQADRKLRQLFKSEINLTDIAKHSEKGTDLLKDEVFEFRPVDGSALENGQENCDTEGDDNLDVSDESLDVQWTGKLNVSQKRRLDQATEKSYCRRKQQSAKHEKNEDDDDDDESPGEDDLDEIEQELYEIVTIEPKRQVCCQCCMDFETREELETHGTKVHMKKKKTNLSKSHVCVICYRRYCSEEALQAHKKIAVKLSVTKIYECKRCAVRFHAPKRRRMHAHNHPKLLDTLGAPKSKSRHKRPPICCMKNCYRVFDSQRALFEHGQMEHASNKTLKMDPGKQHECPVCFKCFETLKALTRHRNRIYRSNMQCSMCGKEFKTRNSLITHERKHLNEKPFPCGHCDKRFPTMQALKCHSLVHNEEKPFVCATCGWSFKRECNLKIHLLTHTDELPFKCDVCKKGFKIVEDDGLPAQICFDCLTHLKQANAFVRKVRLSDRKLRRSLRDQLSDIEKNDSQDEKLDIAGTSHDVWNMVPNKIPQNYETVLKIEMDRDDQLKNEGPSKGNLTTSGTESEHALREKSDKKGPTCAVERDSNSEIYVPSRKQLGKRKPKIDSHSTDSDSNDDLVRKRRLKRRTPRRGHSDKTEGSENEHILEDKLQGMYKMVTIEAGAHICCACLKIFTDRNELIEHGQLAHAKKKYINESKTNICEVCFRRYSKPAPLEAHKQSFIGLTVVYECSRCLTRVIAQNRLQHARTHLKHQDLTNDQKKRDRAERDQLCCAKDCSASFQTESLLIEHGRNVHVANKQNADDQHRRFQCPVCYKRFEKREALTRHRHRMYRSTHQCAVCGKEFKNRYEMLIHERNHDNVKPYSCEICGKRFNSKEAVRVHMLVHSDSKPFSCSICGWRFRRKCNLNKHASKHSQDTPFQCSICQKTFKGKYHLQYHMRVHTGHKPWQCRYCEKSFADHANRARHEMSHTGIKPYKCSYCNKSFIRKRFQIEHESSHTGIKPYRCEMCNRTFSQKTALKKHLEMHPLAPENQLSLSQPSPMPTESPMSSPQAPPLMLPFSAGSEEQLQQQNSMTPNMIPAVQMNGSVLKARWWWECAYDTTTHSRR